MNHASAVLNTTKQAHAIQRANEYNREKRSGTFPDFVPGLLRLDMVSPDWCRDE
jgi:hypothetical protein